MNPPAASAPRGGDSLISDQEMYERMVSAILDHRLAPGTKLVEDRLAAAFGVSRTRVRPVLVRLANEQVVTITPNRGAAIAQPTVALVNNAQREHQEFMNTIEAVARENGAVLQALPADGVAVFPIDEDYTGLWRELAGDRTVRCFGFADAADVYASQIRAVRPYNRTSRAPQNAQRRSNRSSGLTGGCTKYLARLDADLTARFPNTPRNRAPSSARARP